MCVHVMETKSMYKSGFYAFFLGRDVMYAITPNTLSPRESTSHDAQVALADRSLRA